MPERSRPLGRPDNIKIEIKNRMVWTRFIWLRIESMEVSSGHCNNP
jgi:hypothetical protein